MQWAYLLLNGNLGFGSYFAEKQNREPLKQPSFSLTHSCLEIYLTSVVWTYHTFVNNFTIKYELEKYLKESCLLVSDSPFSFKYFLKIAFVREISLKKSGSFGCYSAQLDLTIMASTFFDKLFSENNSRRNVEQNTTNNSSSNILQISAQFLSFDEKYCRSRRHLSRRSAAGMRGLTSTNHPHIPAHLFESRK